MKLLIDFNTNAESEVSVQKQHTVPAVSKISPALDRLLSSDCSLDCLVVPLLDTDRFAHSGGVEIDAN